MRSVIFWVGFFQARFDNLDGTRENVVNQRPGGKLENKREREKGQTGGTLAMVYKQLIVLTDKDLLLVNKGFPGGSDGKESACNVEDPCSIPGSGRSPGEGIGNPFQYSFLENPMDRGAWQATAHGSQNQI